MKYILFIALGGAGGALGRHFLTIWVHSQVDSKFPWGTLCVNLVGSFAIGFVFVFIVERGFFHPDWRSVLMVGFLGAFTTFSTFSLETITLLENGHAAMAMGYIFGSMLVCVGAAWLAISLARLI